MDYFQKEKIKRQQELRLYSFPMGINLKVDKITERDDIKNFVELNYLDPLIDPVDKSKTCSAEVYVTECRNSTDNTDNTVLKDHEYTVKLSCSAHSGIKYFNDNGDFLSSSCYVIND